MNRRSMFSILAAALLALLAAPFRGLLPAPASSVAEAAGFILPDGWEVTAYRWPVAGYKAAG